MLLVAGAGYGKTLALEEALATRQGRSAWVRCSDGDRDPGRLLRHVLAALRDAAPGAIDVFAERLASAQEQVDIQAIAAELVLELERLVVDPLVVVFDDAERLHDAAAATSVIGELLQSQSDCIRTAVASRRPLSLRVAKLLVAGRLAEIGSPELAFTPDECRELLALKRNGPPNAEHVQQLFAATEGWPLGVSLGATRDEAPANEGMLSRSRLFDFLREDVLERLAPELRDCLVESSVPRELNRACMRALGLPDDLPDRAARAGLVLRQVDAVGDWRAYHPLVREFLLERLQAQHSPVRTRELNARVAPALAGAGRGEEAIEHWLAAEAWSEALRGITEVAPTLLRTAPATVRRWLDALPPHFRSSAGCRLFEGILEWQDGRNVESVEHLRAAVTEFSRSGDVVNEWLARFALADPLWGIGEFEEIVALAEGFDSRPALDVGIVAPGVAGYAVGALAALCREEECEALWRRLQVHPQLGPMRSIGRFPMGELLLLRGEFGQLLADHERAIREFERFDPVNRLPLFMQMFGITLVHQGKDAAALKVFLELEEVARTHSGWIVKISQFWRALLHARAGRPEAAEEELARASLRSFGGWREHVLETALALVAALRRDWHEAVAATERALTLSERAVPTERILAVVELAPVLHHAGQSARAHSLIREELDLLGSRSRGARGSYFRSLLLGIGAWLRDADGDAAGAAEQLVLAWDSAGPNAADMVRREWRYLERLLRDALERGAMAPEPVVAAVEEAWPGGEALLPFTEHPNARVRRAAIGPAASSGHAQLIPRLDALANDGDATVATAARAARGRLRAAPPALSFTLLGGFGVQRGSWRVEDAAWNRRVAQRLVRYLLVNRNGGVADDLLIEAFWPDTAEESARRSLKVAVSCARSVLDVPGAASSIERAERTLRLRLRDADSLDVDRFERAATLALSEQGRDRRRLLERAAELWTGEPLPEERYSDWAIPWRERLTARYGDVLRAIVAAAQAAGDTFAASAAAAKLVQLDPLNEHAHRELIVAYARSGRRAHALRQYLECRRHLIDALGIEPARETTQLQQRVLAGEPV